MTGEELFLALSQLSRLDRQLTIEWKKDNGVGPLVEPVNTNYGRVLVVKG